MAVLNISPRNVPKVFFKFSFVWCKDTIVDYSGGLIWTGPWEIEKQIKLIYHKYQIYIPAYIICFLEFKQLKFKTDKEKCNVKVCLVMFLTFVCNYENILLYKFDL